MQVIDALINVPEGTTRPKWVQAEAPRLFMAGLMASDPALRRCVWSADSCSGSGSAFLFSRTFEVRVLSAWGCRVRLPRIVVVVVVAVVVAVLAQCPPLQASSIRFYSHGQRTMHLITGYIRSSAQFRHVLYVNGTKTPEIFSIGKKMYFRDFFLSCV